MKPTWYIAPAGLEAGATEDLDQSMRAAISEPPASYPAFVAVGEGTAADSVNLKNGTCRSGPGLHFCCGGELGCRHLGGWPRIGARVMP